MKLAFLLYRFFPYGGLQRDALRVATACAARGAHPEFHVLDWDGPAPAFPVHRVGARALTRHARNAALARRALALQADPGVHAVVGFNKLPGLDVYYAADDCYRARAWGWWRRLTPRARQFLTHEAAVFGPQADTLALCLTAAEADRYRAAWHTPPARLAVLPPAVPVPVAPEPAARTALRALLRVPGDAPVALFAGSDFARKGLDRALHTLAALPALLRARTHLAVAGADQARPYVRLAGQLGLGAQVHVLGARDDLARLMGGADVLIHPARRETAGLVLLEALSCGLPVLCTAACGYAAQVAESGGGTVLPEPFDAHAAGAALAGLLDAPARAQAAQAGRAWAQRAAAVDFADAVAGHILARAAAHQAGAGTGSGGAGAGAP